MAKVLLADVEAVAAAAGRDPKLLIDGTYIGSGVDSTAAGRDSSDRRDVQKSSRLICWLYTKQAHRECLSSSTRQRS